MKTKYVLALFAMLLLVLPSCSGGGGGGGSSTTTKYTVTYNGNGNTGGSVPVDANHYNSSQTVTVLGNTGTLVKTSYVFSGWNTAADGSGTTYTGGLTFTIGSTNVLLYALWTSETASLGKWDVSTWDNPQWGP
jgi:uncharacterized repeat protein (TIGR02543 family)